MPTFALDDLRRILHQCAGGVATELELDTPFRDLGYDSLALLETAARVEREVGVRLPDDVVAEIDTPHAFLRAVRQRLAGAR